MRLSSILVFTVLLAGAGCGGTSPTSPSGATGGSGGGTLSVRITDSPFSGARAVLITFSEVAVQRGSSWTRVPFPDGAPTWSCDLKKLENSTEDLLASGSLPRDTFTAVRLIVQSAVVYTDAVSTSATPCARTMTPPAGGAFPMTLLSSEGSTNGTFTVTDSTSPIVVVDFDGESSVTRPNPADYRLTPVVRLVTVR